MCKNIFQMLISFMHIKNQTLNFLFPQLVISCFNQMMKTFMYIKDYLGAQMLGLIRNLMEKGLLLDVKSLPTSFSMANSMR